MADTPRREVGFPALLRIESLAAGGSGFGRLGSLAVFVAGSAPGDLVEVAAERRAADFAVAKMVRLVEPSPLRRDPPCPHALVCGGCQWQHVAYSAQLAAKATILADALKRIGHLEGPPPDAVVPSPSEFHYRHRVQLKVAVAGGRVRWGFFAPASHRLVEVRRCLISHPAINALIADLEAFLRSSGVEPSLVGTFEVNVDGTGRRVQAVIHPRRKKFSPSVHGRRLTWPSPEGELDVTVLNASLIRRLPVTTGEFTFETAGMRLSTGAGVFSQNNLSLNPALVSRVLETARPEPLDTVVDIYCGVGNYSIPLAARAGMVVGVENNRRACHYGEANARALGLENVAFVPKTARDAMADLPGGARVVVLNPPRVGAVEVMSDLAALRPERVVYVSCGPATLARDLATLVAAGYRLLRLSPFDMFPQTHHLETVALLDRRGE